MAAVQAERHLRVLFVVPPHTPADERRRYPLVTVVDPTATDGPTERDVELAPQAQALLATLALIEDGMRAIDLQNRRFSASKGSYNKARTNLISALDLAGAGDFLLSPADTAPNRQGPFRLDHDRCVVDLLEIARAASNGDTTAVDDLTHSGEGWINFALWSQDLKDASNVDFDKDRFEGVCADARKRSDSASPDSATRYLTLLRAHCDALPAWFPAGVRFADIIQDVTVRPPSSADDGESEPAEVGNEPSISVREGSGAGAPRRMPWTSALEQLQRVLLIGDPGAGKSWAVKTRALALADEWRTGRSSSVALPVLISAPKLEELLPPQAEATSKPTLANLVAHAMPEDISVDEEAVDFVAAHLTRGGATALLIDGYDEIRSERPRLAQRLGEILALLDEPTSRFVLTTRPATAPLHRVARLASSCELQPFAEREQTRFIESWFYDQPARAAEVQRWVKRRRLELLRTPLLIALFCAVSSDPTDTPPETEPELWHRALNHLASEEDRYDEVGPASEVVRARIALLEEVASRFIAPTGLPDSLSAAGLEDRLAETAKWRQLATLTSRSTVVDDLTSTGIVQKVAGTKEPELCFLHSALRDYLLARVIARHDTWREYIPRLWAQPEWEPVIGYLPTLVSDPDEVILALETRFHDDPLNAARFTAGRALTVAGVAIGQQRRERVRDELLVLLASHDAIDRSRSATLLSALQDPETSALVRMMVSPAIPTRVVVAALRTIAGSTSSESLATLASCARSAEFTLDERQAAVEALADSGSENALLLLRELAADSELESVVRAAAAFSALRLFNEDEPAFALIQNADDASRSARWILAERLAAQAATFGPFIDRVRNAEPIDVDPYCLALFSEGQATDLNTPELVAALPGSPTVDAVASAVERVRAAMSHDPLMATLGRYLLASDRRADVRWRVALSIAAGVAEDAAATWTAIANDLAPRDTLDIAEFLVGEVGRLPADPAAKLSSGLRAGEFGPAGQLAARELDKLVEARPSDDQSASDPPEDAPEGEGSDPDLDEIFRADIDPVLKYQLMRALRRTIPDDGDLRRTAASLSHLVAVEHASTWIDAQPAVAPLVESRLTASHHENARVELARVRARWPGRLDEVREAANVFTPGTLDSRAEAALIADDLDDAATMALASIGASQAQGRRPSVAAVTVLFAAGAASGRTLSTYNQAWGYVKVLPATAERLVLGAWLAAAARNFTTVGEYLDAVPRYLQVTDAGVAALRITAGIADARAFEQVISWAACKRATALLAALKNFTDSESLLDRIQAASTAAQTHAERLEAHWPSAGLDPGDQGTPRWADLLTRIASRLLFDGKPDAAVAVYEAAVDENPNNPTLVNNLGFCQMPVDIGLALETLERAARLYGRPFGVNVANRMLAQVLTGEPERALALADAYYELGPTARGGAWLWDMDAPSTLRESVDILDYIIRLSLKAAMELHRDDVCGVWEGRLALRSARAADAPAEDDEGAH